MVLKVNVPTETLLPLMVTVAVLAPITVPKLAASPDWCGVAPPLQLPVADVLQLPPPATSQFALAGLTTIRSRLPPLTEKLYLQWPRPAPPTVQPLKPLEPSVNDP